MCFEPCSDIGLKEFACKNVLVFFVSLCSGGGGNFVLSSSLTGYTRMIGVTVPMVHHGYGFFYSIRDDR